eukprot:9135369-Pyramimonas_sp.AAC.1
MCIRDRLRTREGGAAIPSHNLPFGRRSLWDQARARGCESAGSRSQTKTTIRAFWDQARARADVHRVVRRVEDAISSKTYHSDEGRVGARRTRGCAPNARARADAHRVVRFVGDARGRGRDPHSAEGRFGTRRAREDGHRVVRGVEDPTGWVTRARTYAHEMHPVLVVYNRRQC